MFAFLHAFGLFVAHLFKSRGQLQAENLFLRHQLNIALRRAPPLSYMKYYNEVRTHLSLEKDSPVPRAVETVGHVLCRPVLGGLHHQYVRI
jgi:hypothetical protein